MCLNEFSYNISLFSLRIALIQNILFVEPMQGISLETDVQYNCNQFHNNISSDCVDYVNLRIHTKEEVEICKECINVKLYKHLINT